MSLIDLINSLYNVYTHFTKYDRIIFMCDQNQLKWGWSGNNFELYDRLENGKHAFANKCVNFVLLTNFVIKGGI